MTTSIFAHLEPVRKYAPATQVAKNVRKDLKLAFPKAKFSVKSDSYSCIRVKWEDGPTTKQVDKLLSKFKPGRFNGMEDIYEHASTPFSDQYGSVDYLFTNREPTKATLQMVIDHLWLAFPVELGSVEKPSCDDGVWCWNRKLIPGMDIEVSSAIRLVAHAYDCLQGRYVVEDTLYIVRRVSEVHNHVKH